MFGAVASKASQVPPSEGALAAPLINALFSDDYNGYATHILNRFELEECKQASERGEPVEQWLTRRWEQVSRLRSEQHQRAEKVFFARVSFYLWRLFQAISQTYSDQNLYASFLRRLGTEDEPFGLVSFNYDTLLDKALAELLGVAAT